MPLLLSLAVEAEEAKIPSVEKPAIEPVPPAKKQEPAPTSEKDEPVEMTNKEQDPDDEAAAAEVAEAAAETAIAKPVTSDPTQVYGWRERITLEGYEGKIDAKLDTGALTSSIHAEEKELFERDGKKWVRFIITEPRKKNSPRVRIEAPLVRIARIKEPGGVSQTREVVRLSFKIGDRKIRGDFTLNNRSNMLSSVLIGRKTVKELGWIDPSRTNLADHKIKR